MSTNVSLTPELAQFVHRKVESGDYTSVSEVVRAGLRLLKDEDQARKLKLKALREAIKKGIESGISSELDIESLLAKLNQK